MPGCTSTSSLYQSELHVPLIVVPPRGIPIRPVAAETTSLRNVAATIVDIAGCGAGSPFPGTSMAGVWRRSIGPPAADGPGESALAELVPNGTLDPRAPDPTRRPWPMAAVVGEGWSYIRQEGELREELYHLARDPRRKQNLAGLDDSRRRLDGMRAALSRMTLGPLTPDRFPP